MKTKLVKSMYELMSNVTCFTRTKFEWHKQSELPVLELRDGSNVNRVKDRFTLHVCIDKSYLWVGDNVHMFDSIKFSAVETFKGQRKITLTDRELIDVYRIYVNNKNTGTEKNATEKSVATAC